MDTINDWEPAVPSPQDLEPMHIPQQQIDRESEQLAIAADSIIPMLTRLREEAVQRLIGDYASNKDLVRPVADLAAADNLLLTIMQKIKNHQ